MDFESGVTDEMVRHFEGPGLFSTIAGHPSLSKYAGDREVMRIVADVRLSPRDELSKHLDNPKIRHIIGVLSDVLVSEDPLLDHVPRAPSAPFIFRRGEVSSAGSSEEYPSAGFSFAAPFTTDAPRPHPTRLDSGGGTGGTDHVFFEVVKSGYLEDVRGLVLEHSTLVHAQDDFGYSGLHLACQNGRSAIAQLLASWGSNIDLKSVVGYTPLHLACIGGHYDIVAALISAGAQTSTADSEGKTAVEYALMSSNEQLISLVLENFHSPPPSSASSPAALHVVGELPDMTDWANEWGDWDFPEPLFGDGESDKEKGLGGDSSELDEDDSGESEEDDTGISKVMDPSSILFLRNLLGSSSESGGGQQSPLPEPSAHIQGGAADRSEPDQLRQRIAELEKQLQEKERMIKMYKDKVDFLEEDYSCIICMDEQVQTAFLTCGHTVACVPCARSIRKGTKSCPICSSYIKRVVRVYRS